MHYNKQIGWLCNDRLQCNRNLVKSMIGDIYLNDNLFTNNHLIVLDVNVGSDNIQDWIIKVGYLDDAGIFGYDENGIQQDDKLYERVASEINYTYHNWNMLHLQKV